MALVAANCAIVLNFIYQLSHFPVDFPGIQIQISATRQPLEKSPTPSTIVFLKQLKLFYSGLQHANTNPGNATSKTSIYIFPCVHIDRLIAAAQLFLVPLQIP